MTEWRAALADAAAVPLRKRGLLVLNLAGLPAIFAGFWAWLYLPVSNVALVAGSALILLILVALLLMLMIVSYCSYYMAHHPLRAVSSEGVHLAGTSVTRRSLAALPSVFVWFLVLAALSATITSVSDHTLDWSKPVASWLTMVSQKPLNFFTVNAVFAAILSALQWFFVPAVLLPSLAGLATATLRRGRIRFWQRVAFRLLRLPLYWAGWLCFAAAGLWVPSLLIGWTPEIEGIPLATASLVLRFCVAMVLAILAWLFLLSLAARLTKQPVENLIVLAGKADPRPV